MLLLLLLLLLLLRAGLTSVVSITALGIGLGRAGLSQWKVGY